MGIFYSYCVKCGQEYNWFLEIDKDFHKCEKCGHCPTIEEAKETRDKFWREE
jgi:exosome complex RNA-binding protein Csl4